MAPNAARRIGVLGGTFDPVHLGHLVVASEVHHALDLDEVVLVPTGRPVAEGRPRRVAAARPPLRMTELAVADDDRLSVSRVDLDRAGPDLQRRHRARPPRAPTAPTPSSSS